MGNRRPGIFNSWSMQEILPRGVGPSWAASPRPVPVSLGSEENFSDKEGTGWKFKNAVVSYRLIARVP